MDQRAGAPADVRTDLDARYGRRPGARARSRRLLAGGAVLAAAASLGWGAWIATDTAERPLSWQDVGYDVRSDTEVRLTFDVAFDADLPAGSRAVCTLRALNQAHAEVGLVDVTAGPADGGSVRVTATIPTAERAVTGVVKECAVAGR